MATSARRAAAGASSFEGFGRRAMQFWHELAAEMSRDWFLANKERYEAEWVQPLTALLTDVSARLAPSYKGVKLGRPTVMRIQRDLRFSRDRTPYKTWIAGGVPLGARPHASVSTVYVHFGLDEEFVGNGWYIFPGESLRRWRRKLADRTKGAEVAALVARLREAGCGIIAHETLTRVPRPFDPDHARADLLRMKGLAVEFPAIPRGLIHKPALVDWVADHARAAAPLALWLHKNLR